MDRVVQTSGGGGVILTITDSTGDGEPEQVLVRVGVSRKSPDKRTVSTSSTSTSILNGIKAEAMEKQSLILQSQSLSIPHTQLHIEEDRDGKERGGGEEKDGENSVGLVHMSGELGSGSGFSEELHFGWGHWFTLRELQIATNGFSSDNVLGEGGYGIVYRGKLPNETMVAVKSLLNNM